MGDKLVKTDEGDNIFVRIEGREVRTDNVNRRGTRVLIIGSDHPHCGGTGRLDRGDEIQPRDGGPPMARVDLDPGAGTPHCYAAASELMPVASSYGREEASSDA